MTAAFGWDVAGYAGFADLRLRPALELLARVPPAGFRRVVDLGCGAGAIAPALRARFAGARLTGVEPSDAMRAAAASAGYDALEPTDAEGWLARGARADLLFSNAALHWAADHARLFPRLLAALEAGGALAVQMPRQEGEPSHRLIDATAARLWPERFAAERAPRCAAPEAYEAWLGPRAATLDLWETIYRMRLGPGADRAAHPVRAFTASTACRPVLERLDADARAAFLAAYDAALDVAYPRASDGSALLPFRRLFLVATVAGG